jgi:general secretion pathway protein A
MGEAVRRSQSPWQVKIMQSSLGTYARDADIYTRFFGLTKRPFALTPDQRFLFWSDQHRPAFTMLEYGVYSRAPITLLTGEVGAGKSTLLYRLLAHGGPELRFGLVSHAHANRGELMHWALQAFDLEPDPDEGQARLFRRFREFLFSEHAAGRRVVLVVDEAQNLDRDTLEELRMLTNVNVGENEPFQLVLAGQPELRETIAHPSLRQFAQRVASSVHLTAMDAGAVDEYLAHRLKIAGAKARVFDRDASTLIAQATGCVPRLVNHLADLAMLYAYTCDRRVVERDLVQQVLDEGAFWHVSLQGAQR